MTKPLLAQKADMNVLDSNGFRHIFQATRGDCLCSTHLGDPPPMIGYGGGRRWYPLCWIMDEIWYVESGDVSKRIEVCQIEDQVTTP